MKTPAAAAKVRRDSVMSSLRRGVASALARRVRGMDFQGCCKLPPFPKTRMLRWQLGYDLRGRLIRCRARGSAWPSSSGCACCSARAWSCSRRRVAARRFASCCRATMERRPPECDFLHAVPRPLATRGTALPGFTPAVPSLHHAGTLNLDTATQEGRRMNEVGTVEIEAVAPAPSSPLLQSRAIEAAPHVATASAAALLAATLAACGGGGDSSGGTGTGGTGGGGGTTPPSAADASRFLAQASMGASREQIARVQALGYAAWIDEQMATASSQTRWDALVAAGYAGVSFKNTEGGFDASAWRKLLSSPDTLRQRVTLALCEIMVTSIDSLTGGGWKAFAAANYLDLLEANAFGNYRTLMQQVSTNTAMGMYLTFRASHKANPVTGSLPDENYARELMQLFTIGLVQLNLDGTPQLSAGAPIATYTLADITGLARVFTGWDFDLQGQSGAVGTATPSFMRRPMIQYPANHELGATTFLGTTIPANTDGVQALKLALDAIFAHANVAPFVSRQLIQRLVTSNPSPAYVARIATVFNNDGSGVKGNLG